MKTLFTYGQSKLFQKSVLICSSIVLLYLFWSIGGKNTTWCQYLESEETSAQETYVSQVIIQAPWGEKNLWFDKEESNPGEFGIHFTGEGPPVSPNGFTVAPNGEIYISDPLNKRIQRFSPGGAFISVIPINAGLICVDNQNNIYTTRSGRPLWYIDKYDQSGNLLQSYPIDIYSKRKISDDWIESRGLGGLYCDNSGNVFIAFHYDFSKLDRAAKAFLDSSWGGICQVGNAARAFSLEEQKGYVIKDAFLGANSSALGKGYFVSNPGGLYLMNYSGDAVKSLGSIQGSFFGCDEKLNIYTTKYDRENRLTIIRKYNPNGTMVSTFGCRCDKPYMTPALGGKYLDNRGNIYVYCESYEDGIQVTKWYKAN
jgi:hypothetical protein